MEPPSRSVAIVDDQESVRKALLRLFRLELFHAEAFSSATALLESLETSPPPDCVVLDLQMPGMTGLDLLRHFATIENAPPVVVLTAAHALRAEQECRSLGVRYYLAKPVDLQRLVDSVRAITELRPTT